MTTKYCITPTLPQLELLVDCVKRHRDRLIGARANTQLSTTVREIDQEVSDLNALIEKLQFEKKYPMEMRDSADEDNEALARTASAQTS